jgi:DNA-binding transcriptional ArsR family regulator
MADRIPRRELDLDELKALAHPLRQRILYHLASVGPANSTAIAKTFGESTGSTSYHLRQLERFGLIDEVQERAKGRERWWRLVPLDLRGKADAEDATAPGAADVADRLGRIGLERDRELVDRYLGNRHRFADWDDAAMFSSSITHLTKDELARFTEEYVELLKRYWREPDERPPDAKPVAAMLSAFPWPGEVDEP